MLTILISIRFSEEMESREQAENNYMNDDDAFDDDEHEEAIDLTEEMDMKPVIKIDTSLSIGSPEMVVDNLPTEALYPSIQLNVSGNTNGMIATDNAAESQQQPKVTHSSTPMWNSSDYCSVAEYKEGEFMSSTVLCPDQDNDEDTNAHVLSTSTEEPKQSVTSSNDLKKRDKSDLEDPAELQAKILQLLSNLERRERTEMRLDQEAQDEDRMFLLSMVSDLKRVPTSKKMLVKAEITTAIARAIQ